MSKQIVFTAEEMGHLKKAYDAKLPALSKKEGMEFLKVRVKNHCVYWFKRMLRKDGKISTADISKKATSFYESMVEDWQYSPMMLKVSKVTKLDEALAYELVSNCYKKYKTRIVAELKKEVEQEALREAERASSMAHTVGIGEDF